MGVDKETIVEAWVIHIMGKGCNDRSKVFDSWEWKQLLKTPFLKENMQGL